MKKSANPDKEFLDSLRNQIEYYLCQKDGIKILDIEHFIATFESMRKEYPDLVGEMEAGAHEKAPNNKQFLIASRVVKWLEDQMNLDNKKENEIEED